MRKVFVGLTAVLAVACASPALSQSETEQIQETEQPGSEFELDVDDDGKVELGRKGTLDPSEDAPDGGGDLLGLGDGNVEKEPLLEPLDGPDDPIDPDPIDEELPGEGPESLSGPDDEDPLPY
jgi:hypothetical protein